VGAELQALNLTAGRVVAAPIAWSDATDPSKATWVFVATEEALIGLQARTYASGKTALAEQWRMQGFATSPILAGGVLFVGGTEAIMRPQVFGLSVMAPGFYRKDIAR